MNATTTTTKNPTLKYETQSCGRCGGSGSYSYCSMYGSTCFKCSGRKTVLTRAGAKARAAVDAFVAEHFSKPVEELVAGDRVTLSGYTKPVTLTRGAHVGGSRYGVGKDEAGQTVWEDYVMIDFNVRRNGVVESTGHGFCKGTKVTLAVGGENWLTVVAFARTIKRGVTVVEPVADEGNPA